MLSVARFVQRRHVLAPVVGLCGVEILKEIKRWLDAIFKRDNVLYHARISLSKSHNTVPYGRLFGLWIRTELGW